MKVTAPHAAVFAAGFLAAVLVHYLLTAKRPRQHQPSAMIPSLIVTQFEAGGPIVVATQSASGSLVIVTQVEFPLLQQPASGIVGRGFLFDGLRPQDLPRMTPPRSHPSLAPPPTFPPPPPLPSDLRK